jgi:alkylation response protein AidB-like acyl-CoA dehydrogenase
MGGLGDDPQAHRVVETLAGACLATTFVLIQHRGAVRAAAAAPERLREEWLRPLCSGERRAAVSQAGVRPGLAALSARRVADGYIFDGEAPWVTGWGFVDVVHTAARQADDTIVWALVDARVSETLTVQPLRLAAVNASRTVQVSFRRHFVPDDRVTSTTPLADWPTRDAASLRTNGSLSLGSAGRCLTLLEPLEPAPAVTLAEELRACRDRLDAPDPDALPPARSAASELTLRAAGTLAVAAGARGILAGEHPQRLLREAAFLLVFGSRPAIRQELLRLVSRPDGSGAGH